MSITPEVWTHNTTSLWLQLWWSVRVFTIQIDTLSPRPDRARKGRISLPRRFFTDTKLSNYWYPFVYTNTLKTFCKFIFLNFLQLCWYGHNKKDISPGLGNNECGIYSVICNHWFSPQINYTPSPPLWPLICCGNMVTTILSEIYH